MDIPCLIALGSNLGDREKNIRDAVARMAEADGITIGDLSSLHETPAIGGPAGQSNFLNAALLLRTSLPANELLAVLQRIERDLGRTREVHWGPRTIDLDLLLFGEQVIDTEALQVPHPLMHTRAFVLAPAAEIAPNLRHPTLGKTLAELHAGLAP